MRNLIIFLLLFNLVACQKEQAKAGDRPTILKDYVREPLNKAHGADRAQSERDGQIKKQADSLKDN